MMHGQKNIKLSKYKPVINRSSIHN